eukprot:14766-Hanusia_phi.AAC.2
MHTSCVLMCMKCVSMISQYEGWDTLKESMIPFTWHWQTMPRSLLVEAGLMGAAYQRQFSSGNMMRTKAVGIRRRVHINSRWGTSPQGGVKQGELKGEGWWGSVFQ